MQNTYRIEGYLWHSFQLFLYVRTETDKVKLIKYTYLRIHMLKTKLTAFFQILFIEEEWL